MKVDVDNLEESGKGWKVRLKVYLSYEEFQTLKIQKLKKIEDFNIDLQDSDLFFTCFLDNQEPWEDEPLEELLKAIKIEVEYHIQCILNNTLDKP